MTGLRITFFRLAVMIFWAGVLLAAAPLPPARNSIVRQVDHVLIQSARAKEVFALLTETLQLPVAWPLSEYGAFASGGVFLGNVNLEIIQSSDSTVSATSRFTGFALEPQPLEASLRELDARGITHGRATPFRRTKFFGRVLWTTVALPTLSSEQVEVFLCEYDDGLSARRSRLREQLRSRDGGPLAVIAVQEIVYGARDQPTTVMQWQRFLDPIAPSSPGYWVLETGPAIRVQKADHDGIEKLVIGVRSLPQARTFLKSHGLLGVDEPAAITLGGPLPNGVRVMLVETKAASAVRATDASGK